MNHRIYLPREKLIDEYITKNQTMKEVAASLNVSVGLVHKMINEYKIPIRTERKKFEMTEEHKEKLRLIRKSRRMTEVQKKRLAECKHNGGIGHRKVRKDGYVSIYFPDHPMSTKDGYIMEHDLIMECLIGRRLREDEIVHHKNHVRCDNRKENLELMTFNDHAKLHMEERWQKKKGGMTY